MKTLTLITINLLLYSCNKFDFPRSGSANHSQEPEISGITALITTTNPSFDPRPQITVSGLSIGDSLEVFSDNTCITSVILPMSATAPSETFTLSADSPEGDQEIYIQVSRGSKKTLCESLSVSYRRLACPSGYAHVPSESNIGFCIMKYEAKLGGDGYPISAPENSPWVNISANDAYASCSSLNTKFGITDKYSLASNEEWMVVAKDIESVPTNWLHSTVPAQNNVVGSGCLKQGNVGDTSDGCGYGNGSTVDFGTSRNSLAMHSLSNGEEVWDLSGNIWEAVDFDKGLPGLQLGPTTCDNWFTDIQSFSCLDFPEIHWKPLNGTSTNYWGMGKIYGGGSGLLLRSASYYNYSNGGIYSLYMNTGPTETDPSTGFRCVYRP